MPLKRMLLATSAVLAFIAPETAAAQNFGHFSNFSHYAQRQDRQRQVRPAPTPAQKSKPTASHNTSVRGSTKPAAAMTKTAEPAAPSPVVAPPPMPVVVAPPPPPLTEEQLAAKAAVDEILSREPALWAAKDRPDPALARAAAEKHRQQELQLAALKAKEEAAAVRQQEPSKKNRVHEEAKAKQKQRAQPRSARDRADVRERPVASKYTTAAVGNTPTRRTSWPESPSRSRR